MKIKVLSKPDAEKSFVCNKENATPKIKPIQAGRKPISAQLIISLSLNLSKKKATIKQSEKEGIRIPIFAAIAPKTPAVCIPA